MAEDLDVEEMLEAPFKKDVSEHFFVIYNYFFYKVAKRNCESQNETVFFTAMQMAGS